MAEICSQYNSRVVIASRRMFIRLANYCGRGGGQVETVLAFYSQNLSSNPAEVICI